MPERGDNAILKLARALDRLDCHLGSRLATFQHPVLGHATLNIGTIRGGTRPNIVPDLAEAEIDIRITPALSADGGALKLLDRTIDEHQLPVKIVNPHENPPMDTPADHPMIRRLLEIEPSIQLAGAPWFSDAAHLASGGVPAVCIGPGSIDQAHTADEFIELAELERGAEILSRFIRSLG
jgi:acetylornithine deacetylase